MVLSWTSKKDGKIEPKDLRVLVPPLERAQK
jgi:hypothetical protein